MLRKSRERGQTALLYTLASTAMFGMAGVAVDVGWMYYREQAAQAAAEAAAWGGAIAALKSSPSGFTCGSSGVVCQSATACPNPIPSPATTNIHSACYYAKDNGFQVTATSNQNVMITAGKGSPSGLSASTSAYYVTAQVSEKAPLTFLAALAKTTGMVVSASSTAIVSSTPAGDCIYVLDPSGSASLNASNGVSVQSECGYWINSTSSSALSVIGGASVKALDSTNINLVGGKNVNNGGSVSPSPVASAAAADPFLARPVPLQRSVTGSHAYSCTYGSSGGCAHTSTSTYQCDYTNFKANTGGSTVSMTPGVYCGGIQIGNVNTVTFASGVYILDGGGMNLGGLGGISQVTASSGVCFFNTGTNATYAGITIGNGVPFTAQANSSGSQAGILFYQDPSLSPTINSTTTVQFQGGSNITLAGSIYLPTTAINFSNGTTTTLSTALVVYDVTFTGGAYFKKDTTNITSLGGSSAAYLVQ